MNRKIIYIINPISGTREKAGLHKLVEEKTKKAGFAFQIFPSVVGGAYSFLIPIIKEEGFTDVIIAGGDGTISQVIGSLRNTDVQFGIIPYGSGNSLALAAGIPVKPEKALQLIFNGHAKYVDGFYMNETFACMLCGLGFDAQVAHDFAAQSNRGFITYLKQTLLNFLSAKTYSFTLKVKGVELNTKAFFVSIANSNQFGNNLTIAPKASLSDGLLDVVIVTHQNKISFALQTLKQIAGWNKLQTDTLTNRKRGVIYFQTDRLTIINNDLAPLHIDGDPAETPDKIEVRVVKNCFKLLQKTNNGVNTF